MTQPPSPSAAALEAARQQIGEYPNLPGTDEERAEWESWTVGWAGVLDAFAAQAVAAERERAAQIAEHIQELEDVALGIPAAIRNQTLTGD